MTLNEIKVDLFPVSENLYSEIIHIIGIDKDYDVASYRKSYRGYIMSITRGSSTLKNKYHFMIRKPAENSFFQRELQGIYKSRKLFESKYSITRKIFNIISFESMFEKYII